MSKAPNNNWWRGGVIYQIYPRSFADSNGDGVRELNGAPFSLNMQFSTQGLPTVVAELVAQHWTDVGIPTTIREVTSDEYRAAQAANEQAFSLLLSFFGMTKS